MPQGKYYAKVAEMSYPPAGGEQTSQTCGIKIRQNRLPDEKLGKQDQNVRQHGPEYYITESYRHGKPVDGKSRHGNGADYHAGAVDQISDDDCLFMVEQDGGDNYVNQTDDKGKKIVRVGGDRMSTEMQHPSAQRDEYERYDRFSDFFSKQHKS
jgi:hypothetical protein